jgi:hypothetical protein
MKMRKYSWIIASVFAVIVVPIAHADVYSNYTLSFTGTGTLPSTPVDITYDQNTKELTSFNVTYDGISFDFASFINSLPNEDRFAVPGCEGATTAETFLISSTSPGCLAVYTPSWYASGIPFDVSDVVCFPITAALGDGPCASENTVAPAAYTSGRGFYDIALVSPTTVPEPPIAYLLGAGLLGVWALAARGKRHVPPASS